MNTPLKTNMTMKKNPPFEDVFPIEKWGYVSNVMLVFILYSDFIRCLVQPHEELKRGSLTTAGCSGSSLLRQPRPRARTPAVCKGWKDKMVPIEQGSLNATHLEGIKLDTNLWQFLRECPEIHNAMKFGLVSYDDPCRTLAAKNKHHCIISRC